MGMLTFQEEVARRLVKQERPAEAARVRAMAHDDFYNRSVDVLARFAPELHP
jgi:hypothetical protein